MLNAWYVWVGGVAATMAVMEAARRFCIGVFKAARSLVRLADALPALLAMPESLRKHADEDADFQQWIIARFENDDREADRS